MLKGFSQITKDILNKTKDSTGLLRKSASCIQLSVSTLHTSKKTKQCTTYLGSPSSQFEWHNFLSTCVMRSGIMITILNECQSVYKNKVASTLCPIRLRHEQILYTVIWPHHCSFLSVRITGSNSGQAVWKQIA